MGETGQFHCAQVNPDKKQLSRNHGFLICLIALSTWGCAHCLDSNENRQSTFVPSQNLHALQWTNAQFTVHPATGDPAYVVAGLQTSIPNLSLTFRHTIPVCVFISPMSRLTWAGSPSDIYIETDQSLIGVRFRQNIGFHFVLSLVSNSQVVNGGVEELSKHVALNTDYYAVVGHQMGMTFRKTGRTPMIGSTIVDLRPIFERALFSSISADGRPERQLSSFSIENGMFRADMVRDIPQYREVEIEGRRLKGRITGTVWIRIADRKLIRATENGLQVYPEGSK